MRSKILLVPLFCMSGASALVASSVSIGKAKFDQYKSALPKTFNVVEGGGWNHVFKLSVDPKKELVQSLVNAIKTNTLPPNETIDTLVDLLHARGKGFDADLVEGEWAIVFNRSGKKSPKLQKLLQTTEKVKKAFSNFDTSTMTFLNLNYTPRGNGVLQAGVKYVPVPEGFTKGADGSVVLRRIMCDIISASFKYGKFPKLPLPLRAKGGYLDFLYLDQDIRITRGNRGGLFIHFRPEFLDQQF